MNGVALSRKELVFLGSRVTIGRFLFSGRSVACSIPESEGIGYYLTRVIYYSVFLMLRRAIAKLSSEVGCGEVTNPK